MGGVTQLHIDRVFCFGLSNHFPYEGLVHPSTSTGLSSSSWTMVVMAQSIWKTSLMAPWKKEKVIQSGLKITGDKWRKQ